MTEEERQQAGTFLVQSVADAAAGRIPGHGALMGGVGDPLGKLRVEVIDRGEEDRAQLD